MISHDELVRLLDYDPDTGIFRWRVNRKKLQQGDVAGCSTKVGYVQIKLHQKLYLAHRLAWFHVTGVWPIDQIDHKDLNKGNNKFVNLRQATSNQNGANKRSIKKTGLKGTTKRTWSTDRVAYEAGIRIDGKKTYLGYFPTEEEAHDAYVTAAKQVFGEFMRSA